MAVLRGAHVFAQGILGAPSGRITIRLLQIDPVFPKNLASKPKKNKTEKKKQNKVPCKNKDGNSFTTLFSGTVAPKVSEKHMFCQECFFFLKNAPKPSQPSTGNSESICNSLIITRPLVWGSLRSHVGDSNTQRQFRPLGLAKKAAILFVCCLHHAETAGPDCAMICSIFSIYFLLAFKSRSTVF